MLSRLFRRNLSSVIAHNVGRPMVQFIEVGPRDGLQNESIVLGVEDKIELIKRLAATGLRQIEAGSLVNYERVPQMNASAKVVKGSASVQPATQLSLLLPHKSFIQHLPANTDEVVLFLSASDTFNEKNIKTNLEGAFQRYADVVKILREQHPHVKIRGSISCCWGCPYEHAVSHSTVLKIIDRYIDLGVDSIDLADTIGVATSKTTEDLVRTVLRHQSLVPYSLHLHDTNGMAVDNALVGVQNGIESVQGSIAGLGGCPFSSKRVGNVDSVKVIEALHERGFHTGVDVAKLREVRAWIMNILNLYRINRA